MKKWGLFLFVLTVFLITTLGNAFALDSALRVGWVIGSDQDNTTVILHTKNGGRTWQVQVDNPEWKGDNDISAVDRRTAWAALGDASGHGVILHTTNGGVTWTEQTLPDDVDVIKNIKGLTRHEAWAVSLTGTILHTTDGGENWSIVPSGIDMRQVNRMDAIGCRCVPIADNSGRNTETIHANVWIADVSNPDPRGSRWGMIHSLYNGDIWRQEYVPFEDDTHGVHNVSAYSPRVVWAVSNYDGTLFRTEDGGETWNDIDTGKIGPNDIDDMCAYSADALWLVQYQGRGPGVIYHVSVEGGVPDVVEFHPVDKNGNVLLYAYEGLTCVDDQTALVVGYQILPLDQSQPLGIILSTNDGGKSWVRQPLPVDDVEFWKVSFVGARR